MRYSKWFKLAVVAVLSIALIGGGCLAARAAFFAPTTVTAYFPTATAIYAGDDVKVSGVTVGRMFGRKRAHHDGWFAAAAKIHLLSASIATYYFAKSLRAEKVSAWRNAAVALFGTDAIKPLLKPAKPLRKAA